MPGSGSRLTRCRSALLLWYYPLRLQIQSTRDVRKGVAMAVWEYTYNARGKGACCTKILVSLEGDVIRQVKIIDGCAGNHTGIEKLVAGCSARDVADKLLGTQCQNGTSCPDQLAKALREALAAGPVAKPAATVGH